MPATVMMGNGYVNNKTKRKKNSKTQWAVLTRVFPDSSLSCSFFTFNPNNTGEKNSLKAWNNGEFNNERARLKQSWMVTRGGEEIININRQINIINMKLYIDMRNEHGGVIEKKSTLHASATLFFTLHCGYKCVWMRWMRGRVCCL